MSAKETYERLKNKGAFKYHISTGKNLTKRDANEVGYTEEQRASFNAALTYGRKQGGKGSLSEDLQDRLSKRGFGSKKTQEGDSKVVTIGDKKPKFKKGGKVRGVGIAKKGVRKCNMR
jgi:hypothetical protein|tara:strand:+ start:415 stop:768 length:354 start_codon:yes stop_codon:yes gene_type:complete